MLNGASLKHPHGLQLMLIWDELSLTLLGDAQRGNRGQVRDVKKGELEVSPEFYQSKWFWVAGSAVGLGGLCLLHLLRISQVRADMKRRLAKEDRIAQDVLHTMLQNLQGLVLKIHAVVKQMAPEEPARRALQDLLDRADEALAECSGQIQSLLDRRSSLFP